MCLFSAVPEIDRGQKEAFVSDPGPAKSQKEKWSAVLQRLSPFRAHRLMPGTGKRGQSLTEGKKAAIRAQIQNGCCRVKPALVRFALQTRFITPGMLSCSGILEAFYV